MPGHGVIHDSDMFHVFVVVLAYRVNIVFKETVENLLTMETLEEFVRGS